MGALALGIASFAIGAVQQVAQYNAQKQQVKTTNSNAIEAWRNDQTEITRRKLQEQDALRQKERQSQLEQAEARAEVQASGAAAGVSGVSLDNLLSDVTRRAATNRAIEEENTSNIMQQLNVQAKGSSAQAKSRINSVSAPSPLSLIAGIASTGISSYTSYYKATNPRGA